MFLFHVRNYLFSEVRYIPPCPKLPVFRSWIDSAVAGLYGWEGETSGRTRLSQAFRPSAQGKESLKKITVLVHLPRAMSPIFLREF
jgi:hypothetical protein